MVSLDQYIQDRIAEDPSFNEGFEEARAELRLGLLLHDLRKTRHLSQAEVAERAGMPQSAVARYEKAGRTPSVTTLWRLARALNVSLVLGPDFSVQAVGCDATPE